VTGTLPRDYLEEFMMVCEERSNDAANDPPTTPEILIASLLHLISAFMYIAKRRARGYRNTENFIKMIYFICGKMKFDYPLQTT
jgi:hypothetical protein